MKHACLVPATDNEDLTAAMATTLRALGMTFDGTAADVEDRAYGILWRNPSARGGFSHSEIQPRLTAAIEQAREQMREFGPINLNDLVVPA